MNTVDQEFEFACFLFIDFHEGNLKKAFGIRTSQLLYKVITNIARHLLSKGEVVWDFKVEDVPVQDWECNVQRHLHCGFGAIDFV